MLLCLHIGDNLLRSKVNYCLVKNTLLVREKVKLINYLIDF